MVCDVHMKVVGKSGATVLAEGVTPDRAADVIAQQPSTPGVVVYRVDR